MNGLTVLFLAIGIAIGVCATAITLCVASDLGRKT